MTCSMTASLDNLNQDGTALEYGRAEEDIPLPCCEWFHAKKYNMRTLKIWQCVIGHTVSS